MNSKKDTVRKIQNNGSCILSVARFPLTCSLSVSDFAS